MKKTILFFFSLLFLNCTNDSISEPENTTTPENPVTEEPETSTETRLPIEINYRFNDLDYNKDYTSENLYTYDDTNRITEIEINSKMNNSNLMKFNYKIIYNGETNLAKGFEIKKYNYETGGASTQYVKLKYPESYTEDIINYAYYDFVNSYNELSNDNFTEVESQKIRIREDFKPSSVDENSFSEFKNITFYYVSEVPHAILFSRGIYNFQKSYEARFQDFLEANPYVAAFYDAKFDYIFWFLFLEDQNFQFEIKSDIKLLVKSDKAPWDSELHYQFGFRNDETMNTYIDNKYPTYKKYTAKNSSYVIYPEIFFNINYFEYNVIYN